MLLIPWGAGAEAMCRFLLISLRPMLDVTSAGGLRINCPRLARLSLCLRHMPLCSSLGGGILLFSPYGLLICYLSLGLRPMFVPRYPNQMSPGSPFHLPAVLLPFYLWRCTAAVGKLFTLASKYAEPGPRIQRSSIKMLAFSGVLSRNTNVIQF